MKFKKLDVIYFILGIFSILIYVWPYYISVLLPGINGALLSFFRYLSYAITILMAFFHRKDLFALLKKSRMVIGLALLFFGILFISTYLNAGKLGELWSAFYMSFFFILLLACAFSHNNIYMFRGMAFVYNVIIIISFITAFIKLPGLTGVYHFAATKNVYLRFVFLGLLINAYIDFFEQGELRIKTLILLGVVCVSNLLFHSSTGFAVTFVVLALLLIRKIILKNDMKIAKARLFLLISVGIGILIVFLRQFTFYANAVESLFGKDVTFTGRSDLWEQALTRILQKPILGYGHVSVGGSLMFGNYYWSSTSCHNLYLDVIIETGIIGLIVFLTMLLLLMRDIDLHVDSRMAQCFTILFFCYLIEFNFEVFLNSGQYIYLFPTLFFLAFCFAGNSKKEHKLRFVWGKHSHKR